MRLTHLYRFDHHVDINHADSLYQYIVAGNQKLVTLIGENHLYGNRCLRPRVPTVTVPAFIHAILHANPQARVMLEYDAHDDAMSIGSKTIRDTFNACVSTQRCNQIIPFEHRYRLLGRENFHLLAFDDMRANHTSRDTFIFFVEQFFVAARDGAFNLSPKYYDKATYDYLMKTYLQEQVEGTFRAIAGRIAENNTTNIQFDLQYAWACVADFFVLAEVLAKPNKEHPVNEYVVVAGEFHSANLHKALFHAPDTFLVTQHTSVYRTSLHATSVDCIPLYNAFTVAPMTIAITDYFAFLFDKDLEKEFKNQRSLLTELSTIDVISNYIASRYMRKSAKRPVKLKTDKK